MLNPDCIDIKMAVHSVALEYARMELQQMVDNGEKTVNKPQTCLDHMYSTYLRSVGYLMSKGDSYIENELNSF